MEINLKLLHRPTSDTTTYVPCSYEEACLTITDIPDGVPEADVIDIALDTVIWGDHVSAKYSDLGQGRIVTGRSRHDHPHRPGHHRGTTPTTPHNPEDLA